MSETRTIQQNKALHKYFSMLSEQLSDAGYDMRSTLKHDVEIPWSQDNVKACMAKPIMMAMFEKEHTSELSTKEINELYEVLNRHTASKLGISVPFPSNEPPMI